MNPQLRSTAVLLILWFLGLFTLSFVFYPQMSDQVPLFAGTMVTKSEFWSMRIQVINFLTAGLALLFLRSLGRVPGFGNLGKVTWVFVATLLVKSTVELAMLFSPELLKVSSALLLPVVVAGAAVALWFLSPLLREKRYKALVFTRAEKVVALVLGLLYLGMNLPAILVLNRV